MMCAVGTGGSLFGTARELRRLGQNTTVIGVEPVESIAFGGPGGAIFAALDILPALPAGSTVVTIICDGSEKHLDTVFDDEWMTRHDLLDPAAELHIDGKLDAAGVPRAHAGQIVTQYA